MTFVLTATLIYNNAFLYWGVDAGWCYMDSKIDPITYDSKAEAAWVAPNLYVATNAISLDEFTILRAMLI